MPSGPAAPLRVIGRYAIYERIAAGGMATVHIGRQLGAAGFARTVAVKRMLPHLATELEFITMFLDEARLAARVRHPNVVPIIDVVAEGDDVFLVMDYVPGEALSSLERVLRKRGDQAPASIAASIVVGMLYGLQAAHEAVAEDGTPLHIVHRDVSPPNVLVGIDGVPRLLDFGVAKATVRLQRTTAQGTLKGKLAYMAPEQATRGEATRQSDIYSVGVVLWELLAGKQLFSADNQAALMLRVLEGEIPPLGDVAPGVDPEVAAVVARAVAKEPTDRFASALDMAVALERALPPASPGMVGAWVKAVSAETLEARAAVVARVELSPIPTEATQPPPRSWATPAVPGGHAGPTGFTPTPPPIPSAPVPVPLPSPLPANLGDITGGALGALSARPPGPFPPLVRPRPARRRRLARLLAVALLGLGVGAAAVALGARWARVEGDGPVNAAGSAATPQGEPAPQDGERVAGEGPDAPRAQPPAGDAPPGSTALMPAGPDGGTLDAGLDAAAPWPPSRGPLPRPKSPCDPPYYIDADGIQRVKRECFR